MKIWLLFLGISFSVFCRAQIPLLPLFEDPSAKWQGRGVLFTVCSPSIAGSETKFNHEIVGDTVFDGKEFTKIRSERKYLQVPCITKPYIFSVVHIHQNGNLFLVEKEGKLDTSLFFAGTTVGSLVKGLGLDSARIDKIDSLELFGNKRRRFYIGNRKEFLSPLIYIDGIGLLHIGPPSYLYKFAETNHTASLSPSGFSLLSCYQQNNNSIVLNTMWAREYYDVESVSLASSCFTSLDLKVGEEANAVKIFVNANLELVSSLHAIKIDIFGADGRKVVENANSTTTDVSMFTPGVYLAKLSFPDGFVCYKFFKE